MKMKFGLLGLLGLICIVLYLGFVAASCISVDRKVIVDNGITVDVKAPAAVEPGYQEAVEAPKEELITKSQVYWITRMDYIQAGCCTLAIIFGSVALICFIVGGVQWCECMKDRFKSTLTLAVSMFTLGIVFLLGTVFTPNTKEAAAIYVIPAVANSHFVQETAPREIKELYGIVKEYIREEFKPKPEEPKK
jgi:hypothetical protein